MELQGFFTQKGIALEAKVLSGATLTITRVTAGSGETAEAATVLDAEKQTLTVGTLHRKNATVTLPVTLTAMMAATNYTLTEIGIYALDPEEGEILSRVYRLQPGLDIIAGSRLTVRFELEETFGSAAAVAVPIAPAELLTEGDLTALMGVAGGLATLDANALVPTAQMPYTYGMDDLEAGVTPLEEGKLHFVYE